MARLERKDVIATLRAARTRDPDVLHAQKAALLEAARGERLLGAISMWSGAVCAGSVVVVRTGVPLLLMLGVSVMFIGWWLRRRGVANTANVEVGFAEYLNERDS